MTMNNTTKIKNANQIDNLYDFLKDTDFIKIIETDEIVSLADFAYFYDGQEVTIQWDI